MLNKLLTIAVLTLPYCGSSIPANACSMASCLNHGIEMRESFVVTVKHAGKPLARVAVEVSGNGKQFTLLTSSDGKVRVAALPMGDYWLNVQLLGISAGSRCFHVDDRPTGEGKRKLAFEWGDEAPATQRIAGKLIDSQPGKGGTPLWNLVHRTDVSIVGASLKLQNPTTGHVYSTASSADGGFAFNTAPPGTYVLHVEGGHAGDQGYNATDKLINLSTQARRNMLLLIQRDPGGGSCGGTSLELRDAD